MSHTITSAAVTIDADAGWRTHIHRPDPETFPHIPDRMGAHLYLGRALELTFCHGYETPAQIVARIDNLAAGLDALRAEVMAPVPSDTPLGIEDDVAGEAVPA
jgi:hypothetical protein